MGMGVVMVFKRIAGLCLSIVCTTTSVIVAEQIDLGESKIIGGTVATAGSFTSSVALTDVYPPTTGERVFSCSGSLITKSIVLTAAHCIDDSYINGTLSSNLRGRVGSNQWKTGGQDFSFCRNVTHPMHNASTLKYDIGLLFMSSPVVLSNLVQPIKLDFDFVSAGVSCVVAGWGVTLTNGEIPDNLHQLQVTTVENDLCITQVAKAGVEYKFNLPPVHPDIEICVVNSPNHGTCNGDSGGALIRLDRGTIIGHVDWGIPCATGAPDVFVRLSAMKDWLLEHIQDDF